MIRNLFILAALFSSVAFSKSELKAETPASKATALNNQAKTALGVDIRSLSFLFEAGPGSFLLKDALVDNGSWPSLQKLERAGYVKLTTHADADGELINIALTLKGQQVLQALSRP